jgi:hypothetical protein
MLNHDNFTPARGLYTNYFGQQTDAITTVPVPASESKLLEGSPNHPEHKHRAATMYQCECGRSDAFKIFGRGYTTVAKCTACENEKVIHEG